MPCFPLFNVVALFRATEASTPFGHLLATASHSWPSQAGAALFCQDQPLNPVDAFCDVGKLALIKFLIYRLHLLTH
jgi:hypothetical protein